MPRKRATARAALAALALALALGVCLGAAGAARAMAGFVPSSEEVGYKSPDTPLFDRWGTWRFEIRYPTRTLPTVRHPVAALYNSVANLLFGFALILARLAVFLIQAGLKTSFAADALGAVASAVSGLRERVFFPLLPLALLAVAAYAVWEGVVRRSQADLVRTLLLVSLVFAVGLYFTSNVEAVVGGACRAMDRMAVYLMAALAAPGQAARGGDPDSVVLLGCEKLWAVAVQNPWAMGTYGRPDYPDPALVSQEEADALARKGAAANVSPGGAQLAAGIVPSGAGAAWGVGLAQAMGGGQAAPGGAGSAGAIAASAGTPWTELFSRHPVGDPLRDDLVDVLGDPGIDHGDHPESPKALGIAGALTQALLGAAALLASGLLFAVALLYGGGMILAQVMVVVLAVIAPVAFLYGLTPAGWQALKKWAFHLAGAVVTRFVYAGALGFLLLLVGVVEGAAAGPGGPTPASVFVANILVLALLVGAIILRGRLVHGALAPLVVLSGIPAWREAGGAAIAPGKSLGGAWARARDGMQAEAARARRAASAAAGAARGAGGLAGGLAGVPVTFEQQVAQAADELLAWRLARARAKHEATGERDALLEEAELRERQGMGPFSQARREQAREEIRRLMESEGLGPAEAAAYLRARDDIEFERAFLGRHGAAPGQAGGGAAAGQAGAPGQGSGAGQPGGGAASRRAQRLQQLEEARRRAQEYARQYASEHSWRATRPGPVMYRAARSAGAAALGWFRRRLGRGP